MDMSGLFEKSTTWALPEGKNEWVDLSMLLFKLPGENSHTPKDIENLFDGRSDVEVNTASMTIEKHGNLLFHTVKILFEKYLT